MSRERAEYAYLKISTQTQSKMLATAITFDSLRRNFLRPELLTQTVGSSDSYVNYSIQPKLNYVNPTTYNPTF